MGARLFYFKLKFGEYKIVLMTSIKVVISPSYFMHFQTKIKLTKLLICLRIISIVIDVSLIFTTIYNADNQ